MESLKERTKWAINYVVKDRGLSNPKMAELLSCSKDTIGSYRNKLAVPKIDFVVKFCDEFEIDHLWFIKGVGEPFPGAREKYPEVCGEAPVVKESSTIPPATDNTQASLFTRAIEMLTGALVSNQTLIKELTSKLAEMSSSPDKRSDTIDQLVDKCADLEEEVKALKDLLLESEKVRKVAEDKSP